MFESLPEPKSDAIMAMMQAFREDPRTDKVDLGVGVYKDAEGRTPVMRAVKEAEKRLLDGQQTKSYVSSAGDLGFNMAMARMVLDDALDPDRLSAVQAVGGSGAIRVLADLAKRARPDATIWMSAPTWPNHPGIFTQAGLKQQSYRYFDAESRGVDFSAMLADLGKAAAGDIVLVHGCCHNPTGANLTAQEWEALTAFVAERGLVPFVDFAYQGFGDGLEEDASGVRYMVTRVPEVMIAASCSKNFGLYRDRVGISLVLSDPASKINTQGALNGLARTNYSMPPDHGAATVRIILEDDALRADWMAELEEMRLRMLNLREGLAKELMERSHSDRFSFIATHRGMFSLIGATQGQVMKLRQDHGIYAITDSRINVAGLREENLGMIADAMLAVGL